MLTVQIAPGLAELERLLGPELAKQARFALALSLTQTAGDARKRLIGGLGKYFTVRSKFVASTMHTERADKATLTATVGSIARQGSNLDMSLHAEGGEKTGKNGGGVGVPIGARPTPSAITRPSSFPGRALKKKRHFTATMSNGLLGVFRRKGKARLPIQLLWRLMPHVDIDPTWPFEEQIKAAIVADWRDRLFAALDRAIRTDRMRQGQPASAKRWSADWMRANAGS